jgi:hypothetical protein
MRLQLSPVDDLDAFDPGAGGHTLSMPCVVSPLSVSWEEIVSICSARFG